MGVEYQVEGRPPRMRHKLLPDVRKEVERMILGDPLIDVISFLAFGWIGAFLLIPWGQWIEYKIDCKKRGKEQADEIRKRWR